YFLNLPNQGFSTEWMSNKALNTDDIQSTNAHVSSELGIQLAAENSSGYPTVEKVSAESPAHAQGIQAGDRLTRITLYTDNSGQPLPKPEVIEATGMAPDAVIQKLQGPGGTKVGLTVERE